MENIQVSVRVRPLNNKEIAKADQFVWSLDPNQKSIALDMPKEIMHSKDITPVKAIEKPFANMNSVSPFTDKTDSYQRSTLSTSRSQHQKTPILCLKSKSKNNILNISSKKDEICFQSQRKSANSQSRRPSQAQLLGIGKQQNYDSRKASSFIFDQCFRDESSNLQIYNQMVKRIALSSLAGVNGTVFVYGQTGSGKTYTMLGNDRDDLSSKHTQNAKNDSGILVHALQDIFKEIKRDESKSYFFRCSYVEIYNEQVFDLLREEESINEILTLNEDKNKEFYIKGAIEQSVLSIDEIMHCLDRGEVNRHYASTKLNHASSRSHVIFSIFVQSINNCLINEDEKQLISENKMPSEQTMRYMTQSILNFVDLAGSEKVSSHYENKDPEELYVTDFWEMSPHIDLKVQNRVQEGKNINKSLFFLTQVISQRADDQAISHIPYRNSPLTKILRSSLGGNARTCIIICITPAMSQVEQTLSSLRFGQSAMKVENKVKQHELPDRNQDAIRILLSDYMNTIKSIEKMYNSGSKIEYQKIIEVILTEKKFIQERIHQIQISRFDKFLNINNHMESQLKIIENQSHTFGNVLMNGVGVLEITDRLLTLIQSKYKNYDLKKEISIKAQQQDHPYVEQSRLNVVSEVLRSSQQMNATQKGHIINLELCLKELQSNNLQLEDLLLEANENMDSKDYLIQNLQQRVNQLSDENEQLKNKEQFYENLDPEYIRSIKDDWLNILDTKFTIITEKLREERTRRVYKDKIEILQLQIRKLQQSDENEELFQKEQAQTQTLEDSVRELKEMEESSQLIETSQQNVSESESSNYNSLVVQQMIEEESRIKIFKGEEVIEPESSIKKFKQEDEHQLLRDKKFNLQFQNCDSQAQQNDRYHKFQQSSTVNESTISRISNKQSDIPHHLQDQEMLLNTLTESQITHEKSIKPSNSPKITYQYSPIMRQIQIDQCEIFMKLSKSEQRRNEPSSSIDQLNNSSQGKISRSSCLNTERHLFPSKIMIERDDLYHSQNNDTLRLKSIQIIEQEKQIEKSKDMNSRRYTITVEESSSKSQKSVLIPSLKIESISNNNNPTVSFQQQAVTSQDRVNQEQVITVVEQLSFRNSPQMMSRFQSKDEDSMEHICTCSKNKEQEEQQQIMNSDSFYAVTNRESIAEMPSNNLFETLQANMQEYLPNQTVINSNDYVSFKQGSNHKSQFEIQGDRILACYNHLQSEEEEGSQSTNSEMSKCFNNQESEEKLHHEMHTIYQERYLQEGIRQQQQSHKKHVSIKEEEVKVEINYQTSRPSQRQFTTFKDFTTKMQKVIADKNIRQLAMQNISEGHTPRVQKKSQQKQSSQQQQSNNENRDHKTKSFTQARTTNISPLTKQSTNAININKIQQEIQKSKTLLQQHQIPKGTTKSGHILSKPLQQQIENRLLQPLLSRKAKDQPKH